MSEQSDKTFKYCFGTTVFAVCVLVVSLCCKAIADVKADEHPKDSALRIHLPREMTIDGNCIRLGQVAVIQGANTLVARAQELTLGRIPLPGQKVILDRSLLLSRLACNDIPASGVTFTGAEKIAVKRLHQVVEGEELVEAAKAFITSSQSFPASCQLDPLRLPKDLLLPAGCGDIELSPRLLESGSRNQARVLLVVLADGKPLETREVILQLKYSARRMVAALDIPKGAALGPDNVRIETALCDNPEPADWAAPYGALARCHIQAQTVISPHMIDLPRPPVLLKRNQTVVVRIETPQLVVTALGKTMQDGRAGEYIKVRNLDSNRIILAKVKDDGTVEPVL